MIVVLQDYIMEKGINAVCVRMAAYIENWLGFFTPRPAGDDAYVIVSKACTSVCQW